MIVRSWQMDLDLESNLFVGHQIRQSWMLLSLQYNSILH